MRFGNSDECAKSELDLFFVPPTQTSIQEGLWDTIQPHPNFSTGPIQFDVPGTSTHYIHMSETELHITARIISSATKENFIETDLVGPVNNFLHSIFNQVEVSLNNKSVENSNNTYAYRAYFDNLLNYSSLEKNTFLQCDVFHKDDAGHMDTSLLQNKADSITPAGGTQTERTIPGEKANSGFVTRRNRFVKNNSVQMKGKIHSDIFNIDRYLLNDINITVKFSRSKNEFCLIGEDSAKFKVVVDEALLKIRRVEISPSVMVAHAMALEKTTAKYPIIRVLVKPFTVPLKTPKTTIVGIHKGIIPRRVILAFVDTEAFNGEPASNPFNFRHYHLNSLNLKVASRPAPYSSPLEFNFDSKENRYIDGYNTLFQGIGERGNDISYFDYANGYTIYAFDLTPDLCSSDHFSLLKDGSLDLDLTFAKTPEKSITLLVYLEFDNIIEITKSRQILFDYIV